MMRCTLYGNCSLVGRKRRFVAPENESSNLSNYPYSGRYLNCIEKQPPNLFNLGWSPSRPTIVQIAYLTYDAFAEFPILFAAFVIAEAVSVISDKVSVSPDYPSTPHNDYNNSPG